MYYTHIFISVDTLSGQNFWFGFPKLIGIWYSIWDNIFLSAPKFLSLETFSYVLNARIYKKKNQFEKLFYFKLKCRKYNFSTISAINFLLRYLLHMAITINIRKQSFAWVAGIARYCSYCLFDYTLVITANIRNLITLYFHQSIMSVPLDTIFLYI